MAINKLTAAQVKAFTEPKKYSDGGGLFLLVKSNGRKYWHFKYMFQGKEYLLSFGPYPGVSLAKARDQRDAARESLDQKIDPRADRKKKKESRGITFKSVAEEWLRKQNKLKAETVTLARRRFEIWVYPEIGSRPVNELEPPDILEVLQRAENVGRNETAHRLRQRIGQVCRYAIITGRAGRDPTQDLKGALSTAPAKNRAAITDPRHVGVLLRAMEAYHGQASTVAALHLLAYTFVRPGELRLATWNEFDLKNCIWRIPGERMKMGKPHIVPLSNQAKTILTDLKPLTGHRPFVFESTRPGRPISENTCNYALRGIGYTGDQMTAHGFRAMASTLLHENGFPPEIIELSLAHAQRSQVAAAYNRSARLKERTEMMQFYSDYLDGLKKRQRRKRKRK